MLEGHVQPGPPGADRKQRNAAQQHHSHWEPGSSSCRLQAVVQDRVPVTRTFVPSARA